MAPGMLNFSFTYFFPGRTLLISQDISPSFCTGRGSLDKSIGLLTCRDFYIFQTLTLVGLWWALNSYFLTELFFLWRSRLYSISSGFCWGIKVLTCHASYHDRIKMPSHHSQFTKLFLPSENPFLWRNRGIYLLSARHTTHFKCQWYDSQAISVSYVRWQQS